MRRFFGEFWQKKPLLKHSVLANIETAIDRKQIIELACRAEVESRLVIGARKTWHVEHGPFRPRDFTRMPPRNWTLLVNGVENHLPAARTLQMQFGFVPYARHDDVMVSYAAPGGGVGPHYDSYDVFLLQGSGTRRWQIGKQRDLALVDDAPLRILRRFRPQRTCTLHSGDLLYLPPEYAHHGIALDECITWSIGLRAPSQQEMALRFLDFLQDRSQFHGKYRDPGLKPQRHPAMIGAAMLSQVRTMLEAISWNAVDIERCLGEYLSEPRPNIVFGRAHRLPASQFARLVATRSIRLDLKSRILLSGSMIFINGESVTVNAATRKTLQQLADQRSLPPGTRIGTAARELLYKWYRAGYVEIGER